MKVIVCVDDNNGMMFNNRRQSRDRILIEDVVKNVVGGNLLMAPYSAPLFKDSNIDEEQLRSTVTKVYDKLEEMGIGKEEVKGILHKLVDFAKSLFN